MTHRSPAAPERLLAAALTEFATQGKSGARTDQIAKRAGVNKQLIFYYYHSKRGLFQAVLSRGACDLEEALAQVDARGGRPLARLRATLAAQFDFLTHNRELVNVLTQAGRSDAYLVV